MMGMPSCREAAERLSREQDEADPGGRRLALRMHLLICAHCRRYDRQLRWLRANLRQALTRAGGWQLSSAARERIRARLARERDSQE